MEWNENLSLAKEVKNSSFLTPAKKTKGKSSYRRFCDIVERGKTKKTRKSTKAIRIPILPNPPVKTTF